VQGNHEVFLPGALSKTGIVWTAPRDLVFAPNSILGFNFVDTDWKQLAEHTMKILGHGSEETLTGVLIRNLCKGTSIECGRGGNVWDLKPSESPWVHHTWVWNTLQAREQSDLSIEND